VEQPEDDLERVRLGLTRRCELGDPFDAAWAVARASLPPVVGTNPYAKSILDRDASLAALDGTIEEWRRAYDRQPPPPRPKPPTLRASSRIRPRGWEG